MTGKRGKNKKAQFFIVGAAILGIIILSTAVIWNATYEDKENVARKKFQTICQNYKEEISEVSKYAIESQGDEKEAIKEFTIQFLNYTNVSAPEFKLLYVYGKDGEAELFNYLGFSVDVNNQQLDGNCPFNQMTGCIKTFTDNQITISSEKINKQYELAEDNRFYFVALEEKDGEKYVCDEKE